MDNWTLDNCAIFFLFFILDDAEGLQQSRLYPYGIQVGDTASVKADDACDTVYNQRLSLFGNQYSRFYVSTIVGLAADKAKCQLSGKNFHIHQ